MLTGDVKKVKNVSREIKEETARTLWAVSAGICEFKGCNNKLYKHHVTGENVNLSEKAHIYAFSPGGKRFSALLPSSKINDIDNLIMVCETCHKLIDSNDTYYPADELIAMKKEHEERIELVTGIKPDLHSEVIVYNCNIGNNIIKINDDVAKMSIIPDHYPSRNVPLSFSPKLELYDNEQEFWRVMSTDLERKYNSYKHELIDKHISLFAIAPQPLLFKLGTLLNRNYDVDVRQSQDNISDWKWKNNVNNICFEVFESNVNSTQKDVVFAVEITAGINDDEIISACGNFKIFRLKAVVYNPKCIQSKEDLNHFIAESRKLLNRIRQEQPIGVCIHLVPIAPASISVELGRNWMKGDPAVILYDRNNQTGKLTKTISFEKQED